MKRFYRIISVCLLGLVPSLCLIEGQSNLITTECYPGSSVVSPIDGVPYLEGTINDDPISVAHHGSTIQSFINQDGSFVTVIGEVYTTAKFKPVGKSEPTVGKWSRYIRVEGEQIETSEMSMVLGMDTYMELAPDLMTQENNNPVQMCIDRENRVWLERER